MYVEIRPRRVFARRGRVALRGSAGLPPADDLGGGNFAVTQHREKTAEEGCRQRDQENGGERPKSYRKKSRGSGLIIYDKRIGKGDIQRYKCGREQKERRADEQ